jgi:glutathione S-transferase
MSELTFYTNPQSRGLIVHWMMEELGEPYETVWIEYGEQMKGAEYLAVNPMGKVPALVHRGTSITECSAIITYLAASFPEKSLMPAAGTAELANFYRWSYFSAGPLELLMTVKSMNWEVPTERERSVGFGKEGDVIEALEYALSKGPFICGDRFTAADVSVGSSIHWAMMFEAIEKRPILQEYVSGLLERPAYIRSQEINEERRQAMDSSA